MLKLVGKITFKNCVYLNLVSDYRLSDHYHHHIVIKHAALISKVSLEGEGGGSNFFFSHQLTLQRVESPFGFSRVSIPVLLRKPSIQLKAGHHWPANETPMDQHCMLAGYRGSGPAFRRNPVDL